MNVDHWKKANKVFEQLMDLTISEALNRLNSMDDINDDVKSMVLQLISTGKNRSEYLSHQLGLKFSFDELRQDNVKLGDEIGGYELIEELGAGGMAYVYKAIKVGATSQKPVAIKIFNHPSLSPVMLDRFAMEQDILAGLSHPNIINMHHSGNTKEGIPFIVMELIKDGIDIEQFVKKNTVSIKQKVKWISDAATAISHAHNNLIIHRDIKPSNLLIDEDKKIKVVDFGIAKLMDKIEAPHKTTIMALTPLFAAPEQINSGQITVATDVFSLAAVCLSLLINEPPLPNDRLLKSCAGDENHIWQLLSQQVKDKDLRNILNQALQQNPEARYRNMDDFADDLTAWLEGKPVKATQDSVFYRIKKFAQRRSALFATLVTLTLTLGFSIVLLSWQYSKTVAEAEKTNQVKNFMLDVFEVTNPDINQGEALSALDLLRKAHKDIDQSYQGQPELKSELLLAIGTAFFQVGDWDEASNVLESALDIAPNKDDILPSYMEVLIALQQTDKVNALSQSTKEIMQSNRNTDSRLLRIESGIAVLNNDLKTAESSLHKARSIDMEYANYTGLLTTTIEQVNLLLLKSEFNAGIELANGFIDKYGKQFTPAHSKILRLKNALSVLYTKIGAFEKSQLLLEEILILQTQYLGDEHPDLLSSMGHLSESYYSQGKLNSAKDISTKAYELAVKKFGAQHPKVISTLDSLANVVFVQGDYERALNLMEQAITISTEFLGGEHVETTKLQRNYATALVALKRNEEAKKVLFDVLSIQQKVLGLSHNDTLYTKISMVRALSALGEHDQAIDYAESAVNTINSNPDLKGPIESNAMFALGFAYFEAQLFEQAIDTFKSIEQHNIEDTQSANYMVLCRTMARSFMAIKSFSQAAEYARKSLELAEQLIGPNHLRTLKIRFFLAEILLKQGENTQAVKLLTDLKSSLDTISNNDNKSLTALISKVDQLLDTMKTAKSNEL